ELANIYSSKYFQLQKGEIKYKNKSNKIENIIINLMSGTQYIISKTNLKKRTEIFEKLKENYIKRFNFIFPIKDFKEMNNKNNCEYCGITLDQINKLGENSKLHNKRSDTRGYSLELDRKHPNLEYSKNNCCMSCYWCNNAKTDEFTFEEFKYVALGINNIWNERLREISNVSIVTFPWKVETKF
ncbi:MAG: hypothetical protein WBG68_05145, partial [Poseidonibacter sp.]